MKLTVIFRGCGQVGIETWQNYATTRNIPLTKEQEELLTPPKGMSFGELILEELKKGRGTMTDNEKMQVIRMVKPKTTSITPLENGLFDCELEGKRYQVEVYIIWDTIKVQGFDERPVDGINRSGGTCQSYERNIAKSKRKVGER